MEHNKTNRGAAVARDLHRHIQQFCNYPHPSHKIGHSD